MDLSAFINVFVLNPLFLHVTLDHSLHLYPPLFFLSRVYPFSPLRPLPTHMLVSEAAYVWCVWSTEKH